LILSLVRSFKAAVDLGEADSSDDRGHARVVHLDISDRSVGMLDRR
jgi:hypothetical protein